MATSLPIFSIIEAKMAQKWRFLLRIGLMTGRERSRDHATHGTLCSDGFPYHHDSKDADIIININNKVVESADDLVEKKRPSRLTNHVIPAPGRFQNACCKFPL